MFGMESKLGGVRLCAFLGIRPHCEIELRMLGSNRLGSRKDCFVGVIDLVTLTYLEPHEPSHKSPCFNLNPIKRGSVSKEKKKKGEKKKKHGKVS